MTRLPTLLLAALAYHGPGPPAPADRPPGPNLAGVNIGGTLDTARERLYADVMRTAREFQTPAGGSASIDRAGWPLEDFRVVVWEGIDRMNGTYALSFRGSAEGVGAALGDASISPPMYDAATNTTTARLLYRNTDGKGLELRFRGTRRTPSSPHASGVTQLRLMRPLTPGSTESEPATSLFHAPIKALLGTFRVVRFMDFLATNGNQQRTWSDRPLPSWASFQRFRNRNGYGWQGIGGPWEHVILLANELGVAPWINVPAKADDDYARKLAQLFRYGSDGVEPYTAPQAHPVHPPLRPDLALYVEYSNEVWNGADPFRVQYLHNLEQSVAEASSPRSPLRFDGPSTATPRQCAWRRLAKRGVELSRIFRQVFGDDAMMSRVRPVLMTQQADGQGTLSEAMRLLHGYYDNGEGEFVPDPHPPRYFFYGAGGSGYYGPALDRDLGDLDELFRSATMDPGRYAAMLRADADRVAALGLKRVCYEGGPSLDRTGHAEGMKAAAARDPRMTAAILAHQRTWSELGGDLFVHYTAVGDHRWGYAFDVHDLGTPKLRAIELLRASPRAPVTYGVTLPAVIDGDRFAFASRHQDRPGAGYRVFRASAGGPSWASYTLRSDRRARWRVSLDISEPREAARIALYWDGDLVAALDAAADSPGDRVVAVEVEATPGLHGLIVRAPRGGFRLERLRVE